MRDLLRSVDAFVFIVGFVAPVLIVLFGIDNVFWPRLEPRACFAEGVIDGDTLRVTCHGQMFTIRLANIDAPEPARCPTQAREAKARLAQIVDGHLLRVSPLYRDRWDRVVAAVETPDGDVSAALVAAGVAKPWPHSPARRPLTDKPKGCPDA